MTQRSLSEIAARVGDCRLAGADLCIDRIAIDSRKVLGGELFAALPGARDDGARFIAAALSAGAAALLLPADASPPAGTPALLARDPRRAASLAAQFLAGDPSERLTVLGVTGTNGKSTCAALLQALMSEGDDRWGLLGTLRYETGATSAPGVLTTPDPVSLARYLAESLESGRRGVAMEVSSHALAQDRIAGVRLAGAIFTNLSRDHLDYHGDMDSYFAAKCRLFEHVRPGAPVIVNGDDPRVATLLAGDESALLSFGRGAEADYRYTPLRASVAGSEFTLAGPGLPGGSISLATTMIGAFNVENAVAASALALALGLPARELAERLGSFKGLPGRMERLSLAGGPDVIVDFAHSPAAVAQALATCRPLCSGRLLAIVGAGGDRDRGKRPQMGRAAQAASDRVFLTSDNPRSEDPDAILAEIETGMDRSLGSWHKESDRRAAIRAALAEASEGDMLLILGKGHETTQEIAGEKFPFSDLEETLAAWLELGGEA